jgi:hypothetical protein
VLTAADRATSGRPDWSLLRSLKRRLRDEGISVFDVAIIEYPDGSHDVLVEVEAGDGRCRVTVPFAPGQAWLHPPRDVDEGAYHLWLQIHEWFSGARKLAFHRIEPPADD